MDEKERNRFFPFKITKIHFFFITEPKIYIIKPLKSIETTLKTQKLMNFTTLLDNARLISLSKNAEIDSNYIMSICCEQHFKGMIDQYLEKVLVNGSVVPMHEYNEYEKIKGKVMALYRKFFYGDHISMFERNIEKRYLAAKQNKWVRFLANSKVLQKIIQKLFISFLANNE